MIWLTSWVFEELVLNGLAANFSLNLPVTLLNVQFEPNLFYLSYES